ncbi:MAG: InlB B-repeat-containing protein, partial [Eubacterium sp.]|nr:InlB B-repeat-containing protein [Candidatus Colimonas fimequi]
ISFDADGGVAVNPEFLNAGEGIKLPTTTKNGYKLDGWYDGNTKVSDGATFTEAKTLKAKWTPQNVNYTINYWQQKPTDAVGAADSAKKYDYVESETKTASAGSTITINNITKTYKGFDKNNNNSTKSVEISGDGTTVVNVYFDRKVVTINYYVYSKNAWKVDSSVQGLYAADLAAGQWRTDRPFHVNRGNSAGSGSLCILLTNFDFETAGYAGNTGNQKATDGTVTVCNFYAANTDRPNTVYYYNEKWDGSFELVGTALSTGTLTFHEKFTGYEPYKFTTSAGNNMTTAAFWTNKDNWSDGTKSSASNVYMASKLKVYKLSYFNYNAVSKTETNIKYTSPLGGYAGYVPAKPDVLPDYYVFKGWYKDPSCTEEFKFNEETMPNANLQVYAKWEPNPTTVTFKVYEGHDSAVELTKEVAVGTKVSKVSPSHPTEDGDYVWEGWKDAAGNWMSEDSEILKPEVLTGQWRYTQKLNVEYKDGIKVVATDDKDYNDGSKAKAIAGLEAEGKYFQGWETETGTVVAPGQEFDVTAAAAGSDKVVTLTALWGDTEQPTTITYDPGNGKGTASTDNLVNNETINLKTISSLGFTAPSDEYYFGGWAKSNGGEIVYADGEKVVVDKEGSANTVYAVWVPKKVIEITANSDELEYNGQEQSVTGFIGEEGLLRKYVPATDEDGTAYKVYGATAEAKGTNVGDYDTITDGSKITVEYANGGDATDKVIVKINPGTLTIYKKAIEVTVDGTTKTDVYDGEEHSNNVTEVTGAPEGVSVTVADTVVAKGTNVGTYTTPITVKDVTVTGADNYDVKVTIGKPVVEIITKKAIEVEVAGTTKYDEYDGQEHSNNVVEVKNVPQGVTVTVDPSVVAKGVNAGEYTKEFTAADVTVTGAENYDVTVKVTAPVKEIITKKKVEIEVAGTTKHDTYDGQEHSNNVVDVKNAPQGVTVTVDSSVVAKGVNAGEYTKEFTARNVNVTGAENYDVTIKVTAPVVEIIDKKPVTVTLEGTTKTDIYNGLEHSNNEVKVTGAPDGVNVAVSKDVVAKGVNVGTYKRPFTEEEVTVTGAENYDVTINITAPVVEIITKNSIEIKVNGTTKTDTYDGQEHSNTVANVTGAPAGVNVTLADTVVAKGVDAKTYTHVITEEEVIVEGADNYNVKITIGDPVVEIIEKAPLNIEVAGTTKHDTYDGQEHSNSDVTVSELPAGVSVAVDESVVAKGIDADTYTKNFTADEVTVTGAENYDVTVTVTAPVVEIIDKAPLNITVAGTTKHDTYDGKEHSNTEVTVSELPAGVRVAVDPSVVAKGIDADTYTKEFTAREVTVTGADNYDVTVTVTAPVVEIIDKAPLTIEVAGTTKTDTYDGQEHSNSKVNVSELPAGVSVAVDPSVVAKGVNADTYTKEFTAKEVAVTGAENYDVTVKVTAPVVEIILQDALVINIDGTTKHDTYDGKEHSNTKVNVSELPEGVTVTLADTVVAKGIDADTYRHAITEEEVTVTGAENYNVVLNIGDPVVEIIDKQPVEIEVAGTTKTDVYDGQKHSNTKVDVTGAPEGVTVTVDETVVAEGIDADTYTKEFTPENVIVTG